MENNRISIKNDIYGGNRIYYWQDQNDVYITDDVFHFVSEEKLKMLPVDENVKHYFDKHGYTPGNCTIYSGIKKMPPASILKITKECGLQIESWWPFSNIDRQPNEKAFQNGIENAVKEALIPLKTCNRPIVLCFSGGVDSSYIELILQELNIPHHLCFFKDDTKSVNVRELKKAHAKAASMGAKLTEIDITTLYDTEIEAEIRKMNYFDHHYARYHFYGTPQIKKLYGDDVIIINGQNSDSILSYGPSEKKFSSRIKRYFLYGCNRLLKSIYAAIIGRMFHVKLSVPRDLQEIKMAFFDNYKYCMLLTAETSKYKHWLNNQIRVLDEMAGPFSSLNNWQMFAKIQTYSHSSDCQVVTLSCKRGG
jgi:hypothetical protein